VVDLPAALDPIIEAIRPALWMRRTSAAVRASSNVVGVARDDGADESICSSVSFTCSRPRQARRDKTDQNCPPTMPRAQPLDIGVDCGARFLVDRGGGGIFAGGLSGGQLKIIRNASFAVFALVLHEPMTWRYAGAFACILGAAAFMFVGK
jgi:hypothetical protein